MQGIGQLIRTYRANRGLTLRELALRVRCSPGALSQIETNKTSPSMRRLRAIEAALDLPAGTLAEPFAWAQLPVQVRDELAALRQVRAQALQLASQMSEIVDHPAGAMAREMVQAQGSCAHLAPLLRRIDTPPGDIAAPLAHPDGWITAPGISAASFALVVDDDSMTPLVVPGDILIFDGAGPPRPGGWGLVELAAELPVIRLTYPAGSGRWRLQAADPACPPREVPAGEIVRVHRPIMVIKQVEGAGPGEDGGGEASGQSPIA